MLSRALIPAILIATLAGGARAAAPMGDAKQGAQLFGACAACHSLAPDRNMTGPSLAGVWGRKAGSLASFGRYSSALKSANVVWDEKTLDRWLKSPEQFIPGTYMTFAGVPNATQRHDLIAFLKEASAGRAPPPSGQSGGMMGGMAPHFTDLKQLGPQHQVRTIRVCRDSYFVTTADGRSVPFWEANLRFKTDSSDTGPLHGKPVIMPAGMMGDRATVFFASPDEISSFIQHGC